MKHAGQAALDQLDELLEALRQLPALREKSRGVFYVKARAFLHFHEDPKGLFGDIRDEAGKDFERIDVTGPAGREALLSAAARRLGPG